MPRVSIWSVWVFPYLAQRSAIEGYGLALNGPGVSIFSLSLFVHGMLTE